MGWIERDARNMRRHRPPAQHHEPPLGYNTIGWKWSHSGSKEQPCGDCGWTPEGEFEKCDAHKEEE